MKFFLLSDNTDALIGMRLAGVEGARVTTAAEAEKQLQRVRADEEIGILLLTPGAAALCPETVAELKRGNRPLPVEIPDGDGNTRTGDSITEYIRNAVGIKL